MRYRLLATVSLAALAIASALPEALAYLKAGPPMAGPGHHRLKTPSSVPPPLDVLVNPQLAVGFRKLRIAYAGNVFRLRRASDNAEGDIPFLGATGFTGSPWDEAAAAAHCASTTCFLVTWYNQGTGANPVQTTPANQLQLVFNCKGLLPCFRSTAATQAAVTAANVTPSATVMSMAAVGMRAGADVGGCAFAQQNGPQNRIIGGAGTFTWLARGGGAGFMTLSAINDAWHAAASTINGAASATNTDGNEVSASALGTLTAGPMGVSGAAATTCNYVEAIVWDNTVLTQPQRAALVANQSSFWGL